MCPGTNCSSIKISYGYSLDMPPKGASNEYSQHKLSGEIKITNVWKLPNFGQVICVLRQVSQDHFLVYGQGKKLAFYTFLQSVCIKGGLK